MRYELDKPPGRKYYDMRFTHPRTHKQAKRGTGKKLRSEAEAWAEKYWQANVEREDRKVTVADIWTTLIAEYKINGTKTLKEAEARWRLRLGAWFGHMYAVAVTSDDIRDYVLSCRDKAGITNGTINRELAMLRRAFTIAVEDKKILSAPKIRQLTKAPPRKGFLEQHEFDHIAAIPMPLWLRALLEVAYCFGCRRGELMKLRVRQVDLFERIVRLEQTKNGEDRNAPMTQEVYMLLTACCQGKKAGDLVFTREDENPKREQGASLLALRASVCAGRRLGPPYSAAAAFSCRAYFLRSLSLTSSNSASSTSSCLPLPPAPPSPLGPEGPAPPPAEACCCSYIFCMSAWAACSSA